MNSWFYAKGGQQQGPVSLEEMKSLLGRGEIDPLQDLVWTSSMPNWLPAAQVPELSATAPAPAMQPFAYPVSQGPLTDIVPGSEPLIPTACLKRAFDLTIRHIGIVIAISVIYFILSMASSFGLAELDKAMGWRPLPAVLLEASGGSPELVEAMESQMGRDLSLPSSIISFVFTVFLMLGLSKAMLDAASGKPFSPATLFSGGKWLLKAVPAYLIFTVMMIAGFILLIVPGVFVLLRFGMHLNAIVDRNMGPFAALGYSWRLTSGNGMNLFVLLLFTVLATVAGCLAMMVGMLFTFPLCFLMWAVAYRWMQYGGRAVMDDPQTQKPMLAALPD